MPEERSIFNPVTKERFVSVMPEAATGGAYVEGRGSCPSGPVRRPGS